ncbi:MAG: T9SS type A sorting domain-containing protein [Crocinitomicaceae bacterium]|nr:T9SS type A sorting domain-containing protein [Crocinitomicaceae bacterium]
MIKANTLIVFLATFLVGNIGLGQCLSTEGEVTMIVYTDDYGYEGYWEMVPAGDACGVNVVATGGNPAVGCGGAGAQNQTPGGYANNGAFNEGPWCLPLSNCYDIHFMEDWGDGGFTIEVFVNGYQIESFEVLDFGGIYTFCVEEPPAYDLSVFSSNVSTYVTTGSFDVSASIFNNGITEITSYDLNYSVNNGPVNTHSVSGTSLLNYQDEVVQHSIPLSVFAIGTYQVKIWTDNFNGGNVDMYNPNDTLSVYVEAGPGTPNVIDSYIGATTVINQVAGIGNQINAPTDLDFHPILTNNELWVSNKGTENSGGSTVTIYNAGLAGQTTTFRTDGNAWHFMSLTTGIAFSQNGNWASSPGVYDANHDGGTPFTGPSLWSSDMSIYAQPSGGNGSHLDMLHLSPLSQGIAAEKDNVFWVFDGNTDDIVRYDFAEDHGPGNSYHGDAIVRRYSDDAVAKDPNNEIVSHLVLDNNQQWLYVVDHGNQRVIRIDITTGSNQGGTPNFPGNEPIAEYTEYTGYTQETVVSGLSKPAGIDVIGDRMIVSEFQSGEIIIYDISTMPAVELERISTGFTSVQGIKIGPNGLIWFVDQDSDGVYKINAGDLGVDELTAEFQVYPNPSTGVINVVLSSGVEGMVEIRDIQGKLVQLTSLTGQSSMINLDVLSGIYFIQLVQDDRHSEPQRIVIE